MVEAPSQVAPKQTTSKITGLSMKKVRARQAEGRSNNLEFRSSRSLVEILRENLFTFFNMVLFILGLLLLIMGQPIEALITSGVLLVNVIVASIQEVRAKRKLDQITLLARPKVTVVREGEKEEIDPSEIVLGDVLIVGPGDQIVVDGELIGDGIIDVDESLLTGETDMIHKAVGDPVYSGSFCVTGRGMYVARRVGIDSLASRLTVEARTFTRHLTPLQREMNLIFRVLLAIVIFFTILLTISSLIENEPMVETVREASVLFGLAPSSLFLMIVVAYAVGAVRLADRGALVQQANSVESLCNVTVLCLDKTGTLTTNQIRLAEIEILDGSANMFTEPEIRKLLGCFVRSATAGNRTSDALLKTCDGHNRPSVEEVPFSSARGWSGLSFDLDDLRGVYVLGAPEILSLKMNLDEGTLETIRESAAVKTAQGLRVLLFAYRPQLAPFFNGDGKPELPAGIMPLCLLSFSDELRPDAKETLAGFAEAGIELKVISGDNPETVVALAKQAGLAGENGTLKVVSGLELDKMDRAQFAQTANEMTVFGRINPRQKARLIRTLRNQGHYVAMTGDGVNDVLALKRANLGIAMQSGSQATRNAADMVLLQDSFSVLPDTFKEGQRILSGMEDILRLYMTRILILAVLVASIAIVGGGFPFTPKQNAVISILTLGIPSLFLALWARPGPVPPVSLTRKLAHFVLPATLTAVAAGLAVYLYFLLTTQDMVYAQHALTYTMIVLGILLIIFVEPPSEVWVGGDVLSGDKRPTVLAIGLLIMFGLFFIIPPVRDFYALVPLRRLLDYLIIAFVLVAWVLTVRYVWRSNLVEKYFNINLSGKNNLNW